MDLSTVSVRELGRKSRHLKGQLPADTQSMKMSHTSKKPSECDLEVRLFIVEVYI